MGRGYITLKFSKEEDMLNVWQGGPWKIEAFDRPVANNRRTRDKTFGHFARVQVDIDVTLDHKDLLIEREDLDTGETFLFLQEYIMEDLTTASNEKQIRDVQNTNNREVLGGDTSNPTSPFGFIGDKRNYDRANNEESNDGITPIRKTPMPPGAEKSPRQVADVSSSTNHNVERHQSTSLGDIKKSQDSLITSAPDPAKDKFTKIRLGNSRARRALSDIVHSVKPEIIDVDEPKKFFGDLPISFLKSIGYTVDVIQNSRNISKPNLWILWKADIPKPNLLSTSDQQVTISCVAYAKYVVITVGHAGHTCAKRRELWLQFAAVAPNGPWCLVGDFNAILFSYEKSGCGPSNQRSMEEFAAMVSTSNLIAVPSTGFKFTQSNNQSASRLVCAKLDRAFANDAWFEEFSKCATKALPRFSFDHSPLLIHSEVIPKLSNIPFKLFRFWMDHDQFLTEVQKTWNEGINGFAIFRIFHKLRRLKVVLKKWAKLVFGNLNSKVSKAKTELEDIHELMENVGFIQQILNDEK
ncbi:hypothetical protein AMTR_s00108p00123240 [Amborella trichopoda]|uniref:DUF4283 domain-containing protein n=1 Tax=Amborella trichopoda TaxID=13333 RepID=W1NVR1_AMBTC|nr:hypothetical protein AMTR_s00108p00123240 [Amborella trichopoda]